MKRRSKIVKKIDKFIDIYKFIVVTIASVILILILMNFLASVGINSLKSKVTNGPLSYSKEMFSEMYPNYTDQEVKQLLDETWGRNSLSKMFEGYQYDESTQFKERPRAGKFVNVDENGFRRIKNQCSYPPRMDNYNVFVFGGSTTFGNGVADDETIPSYLQEILRMRNNDQNICVYNFGRAFYLNSQEKEFFESLLIKGIIPNSTIFIDGLNEPNEIWANTKRLTDFMDGNTLPYLIGDVALIKAARYISASNSGSREIKNVTSIESIERKYMNNKRMIEAIAKAYNIKVFFVIQPVPMYNYNLSYHTVYKNNKGIPLADLQGATNLYHLLETRNITTGKNNFIWLADLQQNETVNLYTDSVHYNGYFDEKIAAEIAKQIKIK